MNRFARPSNPIVGIYLRIELRSMVGYSVQFKNMQSYIHSPMRVHVVVLS
jgi:hypothetical protein